jgi:hypothetical protein
LGRGLLDGGGQASELARGVGDHHSLFAARREACADGVGVQGGDAFSDEGGGVLGFGPGAVRGGDEGSDGDRDPAGLPAREGGDRVFLELGSPSFLYFAYFLYLGFGLSLSLGGIDP